MNSASCDREEITRLRAENEQLRSTLVQRDLAIPSEWKLTPSERTIVLTLLKNDVVTKDSMIALLYGGSGSLPGRKTIDVFLSRIRKKTEQFSFEISTTLGIGYSLKDRVAWVKALKNPARTEVVH
ncbi:helix-turn-helix domain-containing protein [Methylobacterium sp. WCS2018Hpa-22]|uniref:helix-turn-helix domain-containing protein n=1 Tax=Methylobacterium sp. WCS2018Hpa-22 TaxID=3073633 RepID=UPI00288C3D2B|nr:helix-turn-helix domain-containing protein [Methylobacterium sp. WCS2018Hpa-22]